jgi:7,8-dihydroneopterin aldolase/epimerase/oxygenase
MQILLRNIQLYGYHGITTLENKCGTHFAIDMTITLKSNMTIKALEDTIDYVQVYKLLRAQFCEPHSLLEVLAEKILQQVFFQFSSHVEEAEISIMKLNPAVAGFQGSLGVSVKKKQL